MSKHDKTLAKMQRKPVPSDISWDAMAAALKYLGFKQLNNDGSRRKFFHKERGVLIICHAPHPLPDVDKGCINDVVEKLTDHGFFDEVK